MKNDIKGMFTKFKLFENQMNKNYGYRSGDLKHKSETVARMTSGRGTGHFGTGFYFFSTEEKALKYDEGKRELNIVDFTSYDLLKIKSFDDGLKLHDILKKINNTNPIITTKLELLEEIFKYGSDEFYCKENLSILSDYLAYDEINREICLEKIKDVMEGSNEDYEAIFNKVESKFNEELPNKLNKYKDKLLSDLKYALPYNVKVDDGTLNDIWEIYLENCELIDKTDFFSDKRKTMETTSTLIIKFLGYEGVDCRSVEGLDNGMYGSVIYDIKPESIVKEG